MSPVNSINTNDLLAFQKLLKVNPHNDMFTDKINKHFIKKEKNGFFDKYGSSIINGFRLIPEDLFTAENEQNPTKIYNILLNNTDLNTEMRFAVLSFLIKVKYLDILNAALCFLEEITKEEELSIIKKYIHISIPILKTEDECQKLCKVLEHNNPLLNDKKIGRLLLTHFGNKPPHLWAYFVNKGISLIEGTPKNPLPDNLISSSLESVSSNKNFEFAIAKIMHALPMKYWDDFAKALIKHKNIYFDFDFKEILNELDKQWLPGDDSKKIKILIKLTSGIWNHKDKKLRIQILSMIDKHLINGLNNEQNNYIWSRGKGEILKKVVNSSGSLLGVLGIRDNSEDLENQILDIMGHEPPFIASDITQIATGLINHIHINPKLSEALQMRVLELHKIILESDIISDEEKGSTLSILGENILRFDSDKLKYDTLILLKKHINKASEISAWQALQWIAIIITSLNTDNQNKAVELLEKYCKKNPKQSGNRYIDAYTDCQKAIATVNTSRTSDTITSSTVNTSTPFSKNENISFFRKTLLQVSTALQNTWKWFLKRLPSAFRVHIF